MLIEAFRNMEREHREFLNALGAKYAAVVAPNDVRMPAPESSPGQQ